MMTRDEVLAKAYPGNIERIRRLAEVGSLQRQATSSPANELATVFSWYSTDEGWDYWNDLYERGTDR
jgi:hypothetical protein